MSARRFLWRWAASLLALAGVVVLLNLLVDPYEVFATPRIPGFNALKPAARDHAMLVKTYQLARAHPVTIVIGSSIVYLGIDAFGPAWPAAMTPVYNYGIPGDYSPWSSLRTLQEAVNAGGVKNAVVFLDTQNFLVPLRQDTSLTEDERRFRFAPDGAPNPRHPMQAAQDMFFSLATMSALTDSVITILDQRRTFVLNMAPDGSSTEADFINAARADGMRALFDQKLALEAARADRVAQRMAGWQGPVPNLEIVAQMIAFTRAHDVKLTLVIAPHHAAAMEIYWRDGLWPMIEQLKAELTDMVAREGNRVTLWDFLDYSPFNTEPVPPAGDRRAATSWFWETTHFKKQLGEVMIRRMFGTGGPAFGAILTPDSLPRRNARIREDRDSLICERKTVVLAANGGADGCSAPAKPRVPT